MKLNQIASAIINDISAGLKGTTNVSYSIKQIEDEVVNVSRALIKKYSLQGILPLADFIQTIKCIPLECSDVASCCSGIKSGTKALKFSIPRLSTVMGNSSVVWAGSIDRSTRFKTYTDTSFVTHTHRRYNKLPFVWVNQGSRLEGNMIEAFVFNTPYMEYISLDIIAEDPYAALNCCDGNLDEVEFPAPKYIQQEIMEIITKKYVTFYKATNPQIVMPNNQTSNYNA